MIVAEQGKGSHGDAAGVTTAKTYAEAVADHRPHGGMAMEHRALVKALARVNSTISYSLHTLVSPLPVVPPGQGLSVAYRPPRPSTRTLEDLWRTL
jgi:hypothetical protein